MICTSNISEMTLIRKETTIIINQIFDNSTGTYTNSVPIGTYYFAIVAYNPLGVFSEPPICVKIIVANTTANDTSNTNNDTDPDLPSWAIPAIIAGGGIIGVGAALVIYKRKQTFHF